MAVSTPLPVPSPTWSRQPADLPGLSLASARLAGARLWMVRWQGHLEPTWLTLLDPAELDRLGRIPTQCGRLRFAASHAAWHLLPRGPCTSGAHTDELALWAVADQPVGVDAELDRPRARWPRIARQVWPGDPPANWSEFLSRWVVMEAAVKSGGCPTLILSWRSSGHAVCLVLGSI